MEENEDQRAAVLEDGTGTPSPSPKTSAAMGSPQEFLSPLVPKGPSGVFGPMMADAPCAIEKCPVRVQVNARKCGTHLLFVLQHMSANSKP